VVVCALTSNRSKANFPGTVLLDVGEGGLPKLSLIEVSKLSSVEKADLGAYIGKLRPYRIDQIFAALRLLQSLS
jgi:mRNA interferase MazF